MAACSTGSIQSSLRRQSSSTLRAIGGRRSDLWWQLCKESLPCVSQRAFAAWSGHAAVTLRRSPREISHECVGREDERFVRIRDAVVVDPGDEVTIAEGCGHVVDARQFQHRGGCIHIAEYPTVLDRLAAGRVFVLM